jgi:hypothetical protein
MKRFLLQNPGNQKWIHAQEKRQNTKRTVEETARLVRREMFPQLHPRTVEVEVAARSSTVRNELLIEARQRQLFRHLMKELIDTVRPLPIDGKQTTSLYRTKTWEQKSKTIFFYFHKSLGNLDLELTCSIFNQCHDLPKLDHTKTVLWKMGPIC